MNKQICCFGSTWHYFILYQQQFLSLADHSKILLDLRRKPLNKPTVTFHIKPNLTNNLLGRKLRLRKRQQNLPLRTARPGHNLLTLPRNLIILQRVSRRYGLTIQNNKLLIKMYINIKLIYFMFPFLVYFVFESILYVT